MIVTTALVLSLALAATVTGTSNYAPTVTIPEISDVPLGQSAYLVAWATDRESDPIGYRWRLLTKPEGSDAKIEAPDAPITRLRTDVPGIYELTITVFDGTHETVRRLSFVATAGTLPDDGRAIQSKPASAGMIPTTSKPLATCPDPPETRAQAAPRLIRWSKPQRYVDGRLLTSIAGFKVYRTPLPDIQASCDDYAHCLTHYATVYPSNGPRGRETVQQRFSDRAPLSPACYAITTVPVEGSESALSNFLLLL